MKSENGIWHLQVWVLGTKLILEESVFIRIIKTVGLVGFLFYEELADVCLWEWMDVWRMDQAKVLKPHICPWICSIACKGGSLCGGWDFNRLPVYSLWFMDVLMLPPWTGSKIFILLLTPHLLFYMAYITCTHLCRHLRHYTHSLCRYVCTYRLNFKFIFWFLLF